MSAIAVVLGPVIAALVSGGLLALANSLHPLWYAAWIAPIPVLVAAYGASGRRAWWLGFIAGVGGGLSMLEFYAGLMGLAPALFITLLKALVFAGGVRFAWGVRQRIPDWAAAFAFPAWFAAIETLISVLSADGTAGSPAYSQMEFPAALQVAALGGTPAVVFLVSLLPAIVAQAIAGRAAPRRAALGVAPALFVVVLALGFGAARIAGDAPGQELLVGTAALDPVDVLPGDWRAALESYGPLLAQARDRGVGLLVLPEEISLAPAADLPAIEAELARFSREGSMTLAVGFRLSASPSLRNVLLVTTADGRALTYDKQHLVPVYEIPKIAPGEKPPIVAEVDGLRLGGAICKDFDFVDVGRDLGVSGAQLVAAPAWDFGRDAWLHGRMAMLRAVEGGFTLVRSARFGVMSVSDRYGRVLAEAPSGGPNLLVARAPVPPSGVTPYARMGDVFGGASVGLVLVLVLAGFLRRAPSPPAPLPQAEGRNHQK